MSHRSTTLDTGLTVLTERMSDVRSVSVGFWVGTGSVDEPSHLAGASHFLEHLLFKGTEGRSARSIALAVESVGGDMNAFTTKEYTTFYVRLLSDDIVMGLELMSDIVWTPALRPDELDIERQVILEEILMHADEPADQVHDLLTEAMFPGHPLGRDVLGGVETVKAMTASDVAEFHHEHYLPGNVVVAVAGAVDHDQVVDIVAGRTTRTGGGPPARSAPGVAPLARQDVRRDTEQAHLAVAVPGPDRDDEDRHRLAVVEQVLGGGMASRLFQTVREERGLAYSVYAYRLGFQRAGALAVYAGTSPSRGAEVLDLVNAEMDRMAAHGVTAEELASAKGHMRGALALGLEDSGARMSRLGHSQTVHGRVRPLEEVEHDIQSLTLDEVNDAARRWLNGPRTVVSIGPETP